MAERILSSPHKHCDIFSHSEMSFIASPARTMLLLKEDSILDEGKTSLLTSAEEKLKGVDFLANIKAKLQLQSTCKIWRGEKVMQNVEIGSILDSRFIVLLPLGKFWAGSSSHQSITGPSSCCQRFNPLIELKNRKRGLLKR